MYSAWHKTRTRGNVSLLYYPPSRRNLQPKLQTEQNSCQDAVFITQVNVQSGRLSNNTRPVLYERKPSSYFVEQLHQRKLCVVCVGRDNRPVAHGPLCAPLLSAATLTWSALLNTPHHPTTLQLRCVDVIILLSVGFESVDKFFLYFYLNLIKYVSAVRLQIVKTPNALFVKIIINQDCDIKQNVRLYKWHSSRLK